MGRGEVTAIVHHFIVFHFWSVGVHSQAVVAVVWMAIGCARGYSLVLESDQGVNDYLWSTSIE